MELVDCVNGARSRWAQPGDVHWVLRDPRPLRTPIAGVNGTQKLWRWTYGAHTVPQERAPARGNDPRELPKGVTAKARQPAMEAALTTPARAIDELYDVEVLAALRRVAGPPANEVDVLRAASRQLGFARMGARIEAGLKSMVRTAVRRKILAREGKLLRAGTRSAADYNEDELFAAISSMLRPGQVAERVDLIAALAQHFGFDDEENALVLSGIVERAVERGLLVMNGNDAVRRVA